MVIYLQPQKYKCSNCGSENYEQFNEPSISYFSGHNEGVRCLSCGHESKHYVKSIIEQEMGSGGTYTYNPNTPKEF